MSAHDDDTVSLLHAEAEAMSLAEMHLVRYPPFSDLPDAVSVRYIDDFTKILATKGVSKKEAVAMARADLPKIVHDLRGKTASMSHLSSVRFAALIHVAMRIGVSATLTIPGLWECLRVKDYEGASDALMLSSWPRIVGTEEAEKRRALDTVRMLRVGVLTTTYSISTH